MTTAENKFWKHLICSIPIDINENLNQVLTNLFHLDSFFNCVTVALKSRMCQKSTFQCWLCTITAFCWTLSFTYIHLLINSLEKPTCIGYLMSTSTKWEIHDVQFVVLFSHINAVKFFEKSCCSGVYICMYASKIPFCLHLTFNMLLICQFW